MIQVIKATGEREPFSEEKVRNSIQRAGIPDSIREEVLQHIKEKLYNDIPTSEIYHHITEFLSKTDQPFAKSKYSLKQAIMSFGPTGYPFEDFIAELLKNQGYDIEVRAMLPGNCVKHEIDVIAQKDTKKIMVEAKFHNAPGTRSDVHVALYTKARFEDVQDLHHFTEVWLITNTKASIDAIQYGMCSNVRIISWSYPMQGSLRDLIENSGLIPVTALTTLEQRQIQQLLNQHIVVCRDIYKNDMCLDMFQLSAEEKKKVIEEAKFLSGLQ